MNRDYDDLDRALMALPLEEPPRGLRESILASTIYAPAVVPLPLRTWETVIIGTLLAVGSWLAIVLIQHPLQSARLTASLQSVILGFSDPNTLAWLGCGILVAFVATFYNLIPRRVMVRSGRS